MNEEKKTGNEVDEKHLCKRRALPAREPLYGEYGEYFDCVAAEC